ncbi:DNA methyltransferase [Prevotella sp.]|uniref:DNA methyltransferase n=1 Tax=Prevotella sp. TaxID=59823 RepID=UPI001CAE651D|nr:DNA methyltransferase [Prevotella sp.]MBF1597468.1 methyltransferase [Prevotella sp.]MBF1622946.1 methyltransferase [Prevotella sp.]MBF1625349.1 methyltransferase [Prevotella sp.]
MNIKYYSNIGSAKDNMKSPVNNWYKFTAGFSYRFVDDVLDGQKKRKSVVFDPFSGCGTTLVTCQKRNVFAVGNEAQEFMCDIINAKLNWDLEDRIVEKYINKIMDYHDTHFAFDISEEYHPLLITLYDANTLKSIYLLRDAILQIISDEYKLFFKLALSQTLHKCALNPIAVPYIVRSKTLKNSGHPITRFLEIVHKMMEDIHNLPTHKRTAMVYRADSRKKNENLENGLCNLCITSPPYLNNLDYGEISKVHTHFWKITRSWNDLTTNIRSHLVTGATTHYRDNSFEMDTFKEGEFAIDNHDLMEELVPIFYKLQERSKERHGKKSFHILMMYYFQDMYHVLKEIRRVLNSHGAAYLILGDSAPYGEYIQTTSYLGRIAQTVGFNEYEIYKLRDRGTKWKLSNRHNIKLSENILVLR